ncbi:MAG: cell division protein FtsX, partial [Bacteroidaceae bacterium]|nr:cell division protein FtsX [Bacteroidaceae bacterium]
MKRHVSFFNMQAMTSCISMMLVLVLLGALSFFVHTAQNLSKQVKENIAISLLLSDDASGEEIMKTQKLLLKNRYVKQIDFITKEQALKDMIVELGTDPSEFLGHNPFSASLEVGLKAEYANRDSIAWIAKELKNTPLVVDLVYQQEWVETINSMIEKVSLILLCLAGLLTFVSFALINNTLRLSVYSKRFTIHTMKL